MTYTPLMKWFVLNSGQLKLLIMSALLLAAIWSFPPWVGIQEDRGSFQIDPIQLRQEPGHVHAVANCPCLADCVVVYDGADLRDYVGHHPIFTRPEVRHPEGFDYNAGVRIDLRSLALQSVLLLGVTGLLLLRLGRPRSAAKLNA